jgi:DNA-binding IclR family transcriptional regulator
MHISTGFMAFSILDFYRTNRMVQSVRNHDNPGVSSWLDGFFAEALKCDFFMSENQVGGSAVLIQNSSDLLAELRDKTRMTTALAVLAEDQNRGVVLASFPGTGDHAYVPRVGFHFHLHSTAPGKALLAFLPKAHQKNVLSKLNFKLFTDKTYQNSETLEVALKRYSEQGYSIDVGEYAEGVNCVGTCICNEEDEPVAAIWMTALSVELPVCELPVLAKDLMKTARAIAERLAINNPDSSAHVRETLKQAKQFIE